MEGMKQYPDKYFDLVVVDPPYGTISIKNKTGKREYTNKEPKKEYWEELLRVSKNQVIFGVNYFSNVTLCGGRIIWNKLGKDIGRRSQAPTQSDAELAYQSFNNLIKIYSYTWLGNVVGDNYQINPPEFTDRIHISQKPISLYRWIYDNYLPQGGKVLDTHLGSGSNRIAADKMGNIAFTGYEIDPEYYEAQEKRWLQYKSQLTLFQ